MVKQKTSKRSVGHKKRHGGHHRKTKKYHASYWPYIPVLILICSLFLLALVRSPAGSNVLAFATEISSSALLEQTNRQRENAGVPTLTLNERLSAAARDKAEDMAQRNYWSHNTPEGEQPWKFIDAVDYEYTKAGENLAYGFMTSEQTVRGWMNSQSHRENMLDSSFTEVGFGYVNAVNFQGSSEETIVVALYANPVASSTHPVMNESNNAETVIAMTVPDTQQDVKSVTRIESLVGSQFAWMTFSLGILSGVTATGLLASHGVRLRRLIKRGENFILHHPLLDICLVSLLLLLAFLADHVGHIL